MDWLSIIQTVLPFLLSGGIITWVTLRDKKRQEGEKTAQAHEQTKQDKIESAIKEFEYLKDRTVFAEENIPILHKKMVGMQKSINELYTRTTFAENHICLKEDCPDRLPSLGTYRPNCKRLRQGQLPTNESVGLR